MTAWHYTMQKHQTLRWLRTMQSRHSPTTEVISPVKDVQVIYALYHISLPRRIYVGQTINTAFHRFKQHVNAAKRIFRTGSRDDTLPIHRHMAYVGWQGFRIYPLEKIPGSFPPTNDGRTAFRQKALCREVFWKRVLHAFLPTGLCVEGKKPSRVRSPQTTHIATGEQDSDSTYTTSQLSNNDNTRTFASRDLERKTRCLLHSAVAGRFTPVQLGTHTNRNIRRMYDTLHSYTLDYWGVEGMHFEAVSNALFNTMAKPRAVTACQTVIVQLFLHQDLERLGINTVVANEGKWRELVPKATRDRLKRPVLAYKYAPPISRSFCNYGKLAYISLEEMQKILDKPCQCKNPSFRQYQDTNTGHVITTDTSIMRNATLQSLMAKGTKFRCTVHESDATVGNTHEMVQHDLQRAFKTWAAGIKHTYGDADASAVVPWKSFVLNQILELVGGSDMLNSIPASNLLPSNIDLEQLSYIQRHFIITTVDKADNIFCIMCKKHYLIECLRELEQGVAYKVTDRTEPEILLSCQNFNDQFNQTLPEHRGHATLRNDGAGHKNAVIPNFHIRVKMHKEPLGYRFVAGSRDSPLTGVSQWLTLVLKACIPEVHDMWRLVAQQIPGSERAETCWIISDSEEISRLCRSVNRSRRNRQPVPLAAYDFTTMYTKLSLSDLKARLATLINAIFEHKSNTSRAKILLVDQSGHYEWITSPRTGLPPTTRLFDQSKIIEAISFLVDNTYVRFAGRIWHQIVGIPMGTNCAGFLANLYCFTYEFDFLKKVINDKNFVVAEELLRTKRYIDDLLAINGVHLPNHLYLPEGIYPKEILTLVTAAEGETVPYMDLLIRQNRRRGLLTAIYDKRLEDKYANIKVIRYPDTQSVLAMKAKCGIVTSQMYRFLRRCTLAKDFVYNISLVLHRLLEKGYHAAAIWAQVKRFLVKHPHIYGGKHVRTWTKKISVKIDNLARGTCKPGPNGQTRG